MRHIRNFQLLIAAFAVAGASQAWAADFGSDQASLPAASKSSVTDTISFDATPEWSAATGAYADTVLKLGWSHVLGQGWTWGASISEQFRVNGINNTSVETTLGYGNIKLSDAVSLPVSAGIGYVWDGQAGPPATLAWAYYLVSLGLNVKFDSHWTWNVVQGRYRDAFQGGWVTPKVQTGFTYAFDSKTAVYGNVGYSWKNGAADKVSTTWGVRFGF